MRKGKERSIKTDLICQLIQESLDDIRKLPETEKINLIRKLISLLVSWYP